jgi:threonine/homoserine/homoserine lactone efflux protein
VIVVPGPGHCGGDQERLAPRAARALGTSLGVTAGLAAWTIAAAIGVASLVRASAMAFTVLKLIGPLLIWLRSKRCALRAARRAQRSRLRARSTPLYGTPMSPLGGFRQGFLSDIANPKIGVFFTSLLPRFVDRGRPVLLPFLMLARFLCS